MKKIFIVISFLLLATLLVACKEKKPSKKPIVLDPKEEVSIYIDGESSVRAGKSLTLKSVVKGTDNKEVKWEIVGDKFGASIDDEGKINTSLIDGSKIINIKATSIADPLKTATKSITINGKTPLTQDMLDVLDSEQIEFAGSVTINLYEINPFFDKFYQSYNVVIESKMDGTNWYAEYENSETNLPIGLYYKNHEGKACEIGLSFMNDEQYYPMLDDDKNEISWSDAGLYNSLRNLKVSDFIFNEETWAYEYNNLNMDLVNKIIDSANPYDFEPTGFSLVIEDGDIIGISSKSKEDFNIVKNYKAIQEMLVVINTSDVKVPKIEKFKHDESQDELTIALNNMRNLTSYKLDFKEISVSATTNGTVSSGFTEIITNDICHFTPYDVLFNKNIETHIPKPNESYGYKKINDDLYNTYMMDETNNTYKATRAYKKDFSSAKPSFKIAPELFTSYSIDEKTNEKYYYLDKLMCSAASTFYYGVGNDINLYGIFAGIGRVSESKSFTPYVVLKDSYITNACFYFNLGSIYGVVELKYSDFNKTEFNEDIDFTTRNLPTSWKELFITVSNETTNEEVSVVALDYLKEFYDDENIEEKMPFFGKVLDDTFGFAFNTYHKPADKDIGKKAIAFYYDVALDVDYTIDSSMRKIENYLISLGFTKNSYNEYSKDDIVIYPSDAGLDLVIYAWKK